MHRYSILTSETASFLAKNRNQPQPGGRRNDLLAEVGVHVLAAFRQRAFRRERDPAGQVGQERARVEILGRVRDRARSGHPPTPPSAAGPGKAGDGGDMVMG